MRTRRRVYPTDSDGITFRICSKPLKRFRSTSHKRGRHSMCEEEAFERPKKNRRIQRFNSALDLLHDDLLLNVMMALSSCASSPVDIINTMLTCRRFCSLVTHKLSLAKVSPAALGVKAKAWSDGADTFLKQCANAGNVEACYTSGMIKFYCLNFRGVGVSLMAKAAVQQHAPALHSLAVIQFNGSGGRRKDKDLKAGVALCARAAVQGHVDAMRELGHCLQDGYGVPMNVAEGRRFLLEANAREAAAAIPWCVMESTLQAGAVAGCPHHHLVYQSVLRNGKGDLVVTTGTQQANSVGDQGERSPALYRFLPGEAVRC